METLNIQLLQWQKKKKRQLIHYSLLVTAKTISGASPGKTAWTQHHHLRLRIVCFIWICLKLHPTLVQRKHALVRPKRWVPVHLHTSVWFTFSVNAKGPKRGSDIWRIWRSWLAQVKTDGKGLINRRGVAKSHRCLLMCGQGTTVSGEQTRWRRWNSTFSMGQLIKFHIFFI